eukprot:TRINITY_DN39274_c0_g1_i1.p1 TRINITY_DN39274_c0_g1~~TRINITY_DN39274_c0_g1_i1.p1  ORF type:complete len:1512 (+),score=294.56 TRINITY_DN39274_c0_g1_i1:145-4680(+)
MPSAAVLATLAAFITCAGSAATSTATVTVSISPATLTLPSATVSVTRTVTVTATLPSETATASRTLTRTATVSAEATGTVTATRTGTETLTLPSASVTATATAEITLTLPSSTSTATMTAHPTLTDVSETQTLTVTRTGSATLSETVPATATRTATFTLPTASGSVTVTQSVPTATHTATWTRSRERTATVTTTATVTLVSGTGTVTVTQSMPTATRTQTSTRSRERTATVTSTATVTLASATGSVTETVSIPSSTPSVTDTDTTVQTVSLPSLTATVTATVTLPSASASLSLPSATQTVTATVTLLSASASGSATATATRSVTQTETVTATATEPLTRSRTGTRSSTVTATETRPATQTVTVTATSTRTATVSASRTATSTSTASPTLTVTDTVTATATRTATLTASPSATATQSASASRSASGTQSGTATASISDSGTETDTLSSSPSATSTASLPSLTYTPTESSSLPSFSPSPTASLTLPPATSTSTTTHPPTRSESVTQTASSEITRTQSRTFTKPPPSSTRTAPQTETATVSETPTDGLTGTDPATPSVTTPPTPTPRVPTATRTTPGDITAAARVVPKLPSLHVEIGVSTGGGPAVGGVLVIPDTLASGSPTVQGSPCTPSPRIAGALECLLPVFNATGISVTLVITPPHAPSAPDWGGLASTNLVVLAPGHGSTSFYPELPPTATVTHSPTVTPPPTPTPLFPGEAALHSPTSSSLTEDDLGVGAAVYIRLENDVFAPALTIGPWGSSAAVWVDGDGALGELLRGNNSGLVTYELQENSSLLVLKFSPVSGVAAPFGRAREKLRIGLEPHSVLKRLRPGNSQFQLYIENQLDPQEKQKVTAAVATFTGSVAGNPLAATSGAKTDLIFDLVNCPPEEDREELNWGKNPLRLRIEASKYPEAAGSLIGNAVIVFMCLGVHLLGAFMIRLLRSSQHTDMNWFEAMAVARFPSFSLIAVILLYAPLLESGLKLLLHAPAWWEKLLAATAIFLFCPCLPFSIARLVRSPLPRLSGRGVPPFGCRTMDVEGRSKGWGYVLGGQVWYCKPDKTYFRRYALVFKDFRPEFRSWILADLGVVAVLSLIKAFRPGSDAGCNVQTVLCLCVLVLYAWSVRHYKPFIAGLDNDCTFLAAALQAVAVLFAFTSLLRDDPHGPFTAVAGICLVLAGGLVLLMAVVDLLSWFKERWDANIRKRVLGQRKISEDSHDGHPSADIELWTPSRQRTAEGFLDIELEATSLAFQSGSLARQSGSARQSSLQPRLSPTSQNPTPLGSWLPSPSASSASPPAIPAPPRLPAVQSIASPGAKQRPRAASSYNKPRRRKRVATFAGGGTARFRVPQPLLPLDASTLERTDSSSTLGATTVQPLSSPLSPRSPVKSPVRHKNTRRGSGTSSASSGSLVPAGRGSKMARLHTQTPTPGTPHQRAPASASNRGSLVHDCPSENAAADAFAATPRASASPPAAAAAPPAAPPAAAPAAPAAPPQRPPTPPPIPRAPTGSQPGKRVKRVPK